MKRSRSRREEIAIAEEDIIGGAGRRVAIKSRDGATPGLRLTDGAAIMAGTHISSNQGDRRPRGHKVTNSEWLDKFLYLSYKSLLSYSSLYDRLDHLKMCENVVR